MDVREIEQYLLQVKSVKSCRIQVDQGGSIQEIHVVSDLKRSPKQVSRDIQSVLISRFGLNVDYKKISIAQIKQDMAEYSDFRLKLKTIEYSIVDKRSEVRVILEKGEEPYEGIASGPNTSNNILRILGEATLRAVESFFGIDETFLLEDVKSVSLAGREAVIVAVTSVFDGGEQMLSGSAMVNNDKKEAVVKAALNAVNRVILKMST